MDKNFDIHEEQYVQAKEKDFENALRPLTFNDFSGQQKIVENLLMSIAEFFYYRGYVSVRYKLMHFVRAIEDQIEILTAANKPVTVFVHPPRKAHRI